MPIEVPIEVRLWGAPGDAVVVLAGQPPTPPSRWLDTAATRQVLELADETRFAAGVCHRSVLRRKSVLMARPRSSCDDASLLASDAHAFTAFYRRHEDAVLGFFLRRTRSADLAADLTAETFARALEGRERFDASLGDAGAWLFGIARNLLATSQQRGRVDDSVRRRLGMEPLHLDDDALARINALDADPALVALDGLPPDQRAAIVGRVIEEQGYPDLAEQLRCSQSVVRQRVSRGLRTLRDDLEAER